MQQTTVRLDCADLELISVVPNAQLFGFTRIYLFIFVAFTIVSIIVILVFAFSIRYLVHKPVHTLVDAFLEIKGHHFDVRIKQTRNDEFDYLYISFNETMAYLQELIEKVYNQKLLTQRAELKQLQSQINPHFLYNSFYNIYRMAKIEGNENTAKFSNLLSEYYQYITRNAEDEVPLEKEVHHAQIYLNIQAIRFGQRIRTNIADIPASFRHIFVPRLIIQPLLENSFEHGIQNVDNPLISLSFEEFSDSYNLIVEDNGTGLSDAELISARIDNACLVSATSTELAAKIDAIFAEYISSKANAFCLFEGHRYLFWLIQKKSQIYSNDTLYRYISGTLEQIQLCCKQVGLPVSFIWDPTLYSWMQLPLGYDRLRSVVYFLLNPKEEMVLCDTNFFHGFLEQDVCVSSNSNEAILDDMRTKLEYGQLEELFSCIDKILMQISNNSDPIRQISAYHGLCTFFLDWIERTGQKRAYLQQFGSFSVFSLPYNQWTPSMIQTFRDIAQFLINGSNSTQAQRFNQIVQTLHQYISEHLAEDLTLTTLASQVYLNPVYLSRAYRQATGQKLSEYVLECRVKEAKKMLKGRDYKINEIAFAVGFDSAAHFSRVFKKQTTLTPLEYRERTFQK